MKLRTSECLQVCYSLQAQDPPTCSILVGDQYGEYSALVNILPANERSFTRVKRALNQLDLRSLFHGFVFVTVFSSRSIIPTSPLLYWSQVFAVLSNQLFRAFDTKPSGIKQVSILHRIHDQRHFELIIGLLQNRLCTFSQTSSSKPESTDGARNGCRCNACIIRANWPFEHPAVSPRLLAETLLVHAI